MHSRMHGYNHIATTFAILHNSNFGRQKVAPSCIVQVQKLCFVVSAVASSTDVRQTQSTWMIWNMHW